jgi:hypothetical protein
VLHPERHQRPRESLPLRMSCEEQRRISCLLKHLKLDGERTLLTSKMNEYDSDSSEESSDGSSKKCSDGRCGLRHTGVGGPRHSEID